MRNEEAVENRITTSASWKTDHSSKKGSKEAQMDFNGIIRSIMNLNLIILHGLF